MDLFRSKFDNFKLKINLLKTAIENYFLSPQCYNYLFENFKFLNVIPRNLNEIYFEISNHKRLFISLVNCIILWINVLIFILLFVEYNKINMIFHLNLYFDQLKQMIFFLIDTMILASTLKTDLVIEEFQHNLDVFKIFYYLNHNLMDKHKLNDRNYKILTLLTRSLTISGQLFYIPFVMFMAVSYVLVTGVWKESFWLTLFIVEIYYAIFIIETIFSAYIILIPLITFYYRSLFAQISQSIKYQLINEKVKSIKLDFKLFQLIKEHNLVLLRLNKVNHYIRRSLAIFFLTSAIMEDMFIYLAIYSNNFWHKIVCSICAFAYFFIGFTICYLLSWTSKSAHQSYKTIFSILSKQKINFRIKYKACNLDFNHVKM